MIQVLMIPVFHMLGHLHREKGRGFQIRIL